MASTRQLKARIRTVSSTGQITKAMQLVAASKMRRAIEEDKASAPYATAANELLAHLAVQEGAAERPLFRVRPVKRRLLVVIASDKGLAGAYNSNIIKRLLLELAADERDGIQDSLISVGQRVGSFAVRLRGLNVVGAYDGLPDNLTVGQIRPIVDTSMESFLTGKVDAVDMIYTEFFSSLKQSVRVRRLFPAGYTAAKVATDIKFAKYEPSPAEVLDSVAYQMTLAQAFQAMLDAHASEHSMRMVAMKNASDNAAQLSDDLTLEMNKARQGAITQELAEISGGVEAISE